MKVAFVHDWLVVHGGAEQVTRELVDLCDADVFALDHQFTGAYTTSIERPGDVRQMGANYRIPFYRLGGVFGASYTRSTVVGDFGTQKSTGAGQTMGVNYSHYLAPEGGYRSYVTVGLDDRRPHLTVVDGLPQAIAEIHALDHDALVEPFIEGSDVEVPVITVNGEPAMLPMMIFEQADPAHLRTYQEKRDLVDRSAKYSLKLFDDITMNDRLIAYTRKLAEIFRPFDYGRFEFRVDFATGEIRLLEVNLNCNLWSEKVFGRAAVAAGFSQAELIETIVAESMMRQLVAVGARQHAA